MYRMIVEVPKKSLIKTRKPGKKTIEKQRKVKIIILIVRDKVTNSKG